MGQILVRNVADDAIESFKQRAKSKGTSLEQEIRDLIERNAPWSPEEKLAAALKYQAKTPPGPKTDVVQLLREDRDR